MSTDDERFEVQRLQRSNGYWLNLEPDNSNDRKTAEAGLAHLRRTMPNEAFRVVPFGFGPNARLGDVNEQGSIKVDGGWCHADSGHLESTAVMVTPEQADNAELYGWERQGDLIPGAEGLVVRVIR